MLQVKINADVILTGGLRNRTDLEKASESGTRYFGLARLFIRNTVFLETLRE